MIIRGNTVSTPISPEKLGSVLYTQQTLTEEQKAQARENIDVPSYYELEDLRNDILINNSKHDEDMLDVDTRLDELEKGYRHIATYTNDTGEDVMQIDITQDKDGNPFSCSEFFIYAIIPPASGGQIYIGSPMWAWIFFSGEGKSTNATKTLSINISHKGGGYWSGNMLAANNVESAFSAKSGSSLYTNFRSDSVIGEKANNLCFYGGNSPFPDGTVIEIYGK